MKYVILVGDGMADLPLPELNGKTPLEAAKTPNMDQIAKEGIAGWVKNIPSGMQPGSDVASLSVFGYDPTKDYTGRAPLEAASMGVELDKDEVAFRCNFVTIENGVMRDFTAGHISSEEAKELISFLEGELGSREINFHSGVSYRNLVVIKNGPEGAECIAPHDITDKKIENYLPKGDGTELLNSLMEKSIKLLANHPVNQKRIAQNKRPASMIWLWGQGKAPKVQTLFDRYKLVGSVIAAVDLIKGIGVYAGLDVINVPGVTGYIDTNYQGKAEYALKSLKNKDFVFVHVEAPDEAGHEGDLAKKIKAIEDFDRLTVGTILVGIKKFKEFKILVLPDHPTPISLKTHTSDPVPFAMFGTGIEADQVTAFNEKAVSHSKLKLERGYELIDLFIKGVNHNVAKRHY